MSDTLNPDNVRDFDAALDMGGYDCENCGWNSDQLQAHVDGFFMLTNRTGCYNWNTVVVDDAQEAEDTLRDWASWYLEQGHVTQGALDAFVSKVRKALDTLNAVTA